MSDRASIAAGGTIVVVFLFLSAAAGWLQGVTARAVFDWLRNLDPRLWQAFVAGVFLAMGWIVNGWQNRRVAAQLRAERLRDAHRAIFAEIDANLSNLLDEGSLRAEGAEMIARMDGDPDFVPLIPRERHDRIFSALEEEIHVLPRVTIDPIVAYYSQLGSLGAHVDDMRGNAFKTMAPDRRVAMYRDYIDMKAAALRLGRKAVWLIEVYAADGKDAAEAEAARLDVNSRDGARSAL
ncbi:MAG: hypothetical protein AAFY65_10770 [Pseudomonadota bacterium]